MESEGTLFMFLFIAAIATGGVAIASHRFDAALLAGIMVMMVYLSVVLLNILSVGRDFIRLFTDPAHLARQEFKGVFQLLVQRSREINKLGGMYDRVVNIRAHQNDVHNTPGESVPQDR